MQYYTVILLSEKESLSQFRINKILTQLPCGAYLATQEIFFVHCNQELDESRLSRLTNLLEAKVMDMVTLSSRSVLIVPRFGTTSAWSSKTLEIVHRCGLDHILGVEKGIIYQSNIELTPYVHLIHDRMTETAVIETKQVKKIFNYKDGDSYKEIQVFDGHSSLEKINKEIGLALSKDEMQYLLDYYIKIGRNPTDVELMMFAQANSEHCRHKIFNATFLINQVSQNKSLFQLIKDTYANAPTSILVAYSDNSSVIQGVEIDKFYPFFENKQYGFHRVLTHVLMKVETHNHPTAISPFAGAATGGGGEIRDEGATGCGAKPKAGITGFTVSNLKFDSNYSSFDKPCYIKSSLDIMIEAPVGSASFNNEFGRPNLGGYFRVFEQEVKGVHYGYHKPIMIAGGFGNIADKNVVKKEVTTNALIIHLGGPGFLIGLGGGAASSMSGGENLVELDFNSVQRSNPEMERRCQEVIDTCSQLDSENPILAIHDVGAGGLSNAVPELLYGSNKGGRFDLRAIPVYDTSMNPLEIWCNESQERYVLAINPDKLDILKSICTRENCPFTILGYATEDKRLILHDDRYNNNPIDMDLDILLGKLPKINKEVVYKSEIIGSSRDISVLNFKDAVYKVIAHPTVACKSFLITIGDRSVGGLTARDQMVGKWQVPVADCAITTFGFNTYGGEVAGIGERTSLAVVNAQASGRMAIAESLTNIASCKINNINDVKLSANWMASSESENQSALLYNTVKAVSELCKELNVAIPVGKDSLSMKMKWEHKEVISPVSLVISAFAITPDVRKHVTPVLKACMNSCLVLVGLSTKNRMGGSILQQCYNDVGGYAPDIDDGRALLGLFNLIQELHQKDYMLAYHDRSDGGLITTLSEMVFASRMGIEVNCNSELNLHEFMFNEEIGVVIQIENEKLEPIVELVKKYDLVSVVLGNINVDVDNLVIKQNGVIVLDEIRSNLQRLWLDTSYNIQRLRDNPDCASSELAANLDSNNKGLFAKVGFDFDFSPKIIITKPKIAILREQGVNGQVEMAAAFVAAGFDAYDVHMSDLLSGKISLSKFMGLAACGGFSYGDVLGAGTGWAKSILFNSKLKDEFSSFFQRSDTFALGVCNGCQMMAQLKDIIPGAGGFPQITRNISEQFEARLCMVEITKSPSIFLQGMENSQIPIVVSHGEGFMDFRETSLDNSLIAMRYIDNMGEVTEVYPYNPNGSSSGITAVTNKDGRFTIMMPHPERIYKTSQMSWFDDSWGDYSPWFRIFLNANEFLK